SIYSQRNSLALIKFIIKSYSLSQEIYTIKDMYNYINTLKMKLLIPEDVMEQCPDPKYKNYYRNVAKIYSKYEELLLANNALDYSDLIKKTIYVLRKNPHILKYYQDKFLYVHVDEYQDTNYSQYTFIKMIAQPQNNLFVVGDDFQSIYSFRGADISNILNFKIDYPNAKVVKLERNYRSTKNIIKVSNKLIKNNTQNISKNLWTKNKEGSLVKIIKTKNPYEEALFIVKKINDLKILYGYSYKDFAVFFRTNNQAYHVVKIFDKFHIPYKTKGRKSLLEKKEIQDFLGYLYLLVNPYNQSALSNVMNLEIEGVSDKLIDSINAYMSANNMNIYQMLENINKVYGIGKKRARKIKNLKTKVLDNLLKYKSNNKDLYKTIKKIYEAIEYKKKIQKKYSDDSEEKIINLKKFFFMVQVYQQNHPEDGLEDFLLKQSLLEDDNDNNNNNNDDVSLMTVHSSKGLEFPVVFVAGVEDGVYPHNISINEQDTGINPYAIEEERRLFYVAITRAQKKLFLSFNKERYTMKGKRKMNKSRFLKEIEKENSVEFYNYKYKKGVK
ncbi:MAG: ATP-dependent helicase, partial [archaeon]